MNTIEELVVRVLNGDMRAFEALYEQTSKQVYYTCYSFLGNEQDALDVMQDTYLAALTHLQELVYKDRFCQWINQIAVNKSKSQLSKKMPIPMEEENFELLPMEENDNFLPENYVTVKEKRQLVLNIMSETLTAAQYQTIILYYFDGMSTQEIADCMGCSIGTVTSRLSAARAKIKHGVQDYEDTTGQKLYSVAGIPFLAALLAAESESLIVPNVLAEIIGAVGAGGIVQATMGTGIGAANIVQGTAEADTIGAVATASSATKKGLGVLFATAKAKLVAGVVAVAVIGGGIAAVAVLSSDNRGKSDTTQEIGMSDELVTDADTEGMVSEDVSDDIMQEEGDLSDETEEENVLSDEPLPLIDRYGTEDQFAFTVDGKNYIFTASDTVKLFSTSGSWDETYENIISDPVSLIVLVDGETMNLLYYKTAQDFANEESECEILFQEGNSTLYRYLEDYDDDEDEPYYYYYLKCKDIVFNANKFGGLLEEGISENNIWEQLKLVEGTVSEADGTAEELFLHGNIMAKETIPGYRFAFRPSTNPSWSSRFNVEDGNSVYREEAILLVYYMGLYIDGEYHLIDISYEENADTTQSYETTEAMEDTGLRFGEYIIYEDKHAWISNREYVIVLPESDRLMRIESWDFDITPELALEFLELALVSVE